MNKTGLTIKVWAEGDIIEENVFYLGMPNELYHEQRDYLSNSMLSVAVDNLYKLENPPEREVSRHFQIGTAVHAKILEPETFDDRYILLPEVKDRRQTEYKRAAEAVGADNVFVGDTVKMIGDINNAVRSNDAAAHYLNQGGYSELSVFTTCPLTGLKMRVRFDRLVALDNGSFVGFDLKTTRDNTPHHFSRSVYNYRYHVQQAFYSRVFHIATGFELEGFVFCSVESTYPHIVRVFRLCDISLMAANDTLLKDLEHYSQYKQGEIVPHNNEPETLISLPDFAMQDYLEGDL